MSNAELNPKEFEIGSVAYYVSKYSNGEPYVDYGIVEEHYPSCVCLEKLEIVEFRIINGIPYDKFKTPTPWKKLPKGWSYDTKMWEETVDAEFAERASTISVKDPEQIIEAYKNGILIPRIKATFSRIETEFGDGFNGGAKGEYRLVKRSSIPPFVQSPSAHISIEWRKVYKTYCKAKAVIDEEIKEKKRVAALSDYEWAVEGIDRSLDSLVSRYGISEQDRLRYREWLLSLSNVEEIDTRVHTGVLQWKYAKNKKWMEIHF